MKKILFATTALVMTAGMAAAEVKITGAANIGAGSHDGGDVIVYNNATISASASGATDSGLEFGFSGWSMRGGDGYTFGDTDDGHYGPHETPSVPEVYVSGAFGKLAVKRNGYNFFYNDSSSDDADIKYSLSAGGLSVAVVADLRGTAANAAGAVAGSSDFSLSADAALGGVAANLVYDSRGSNSLVSLSYPVGAITATVGVDANAAETIKIAYSADGVSASFKYGTDEAWKITAGMTSGAVGVNVETTSADKWQATASYDLGGGAKLNGGVNYEEDLYAGLSFSF
jgi:outer membrane protein OmpU